MLNLYVVIRAGSFSRHAVDMPSLCEYYDLYGCSRNWTQDLSVRADLANYSTIPHGLGLVESPTFNDPWSRGFQTFLVAQERDPTQRPKSWSLNDVIPQIRPLALSHVISGIVRNALIMESLLSSHLL